MNLEGQNLSVENAAPLFLLRKISHLGLMAQKCGYSRKHSAYTRLFCAIASLFYIAYANIFNIEIAIQTIF